MRLMQLDPKLTWIIFCVEDGRFYVGDAEHAFGIPLHQPDAPSSLKAESLGGPCNLPLSPDVYDAFRRQSWHGFQFLDLESARKAPAGDMLRMLVFGPDYGDCLLHRATGMIFSLRGGSIQMLSRDLKPIEKTKTRGRAVLAFAAHPTEGVIAYGDNFGTFHAQRFDAGKFGKATRIIVKERKASRLEFAKDGSKLMIGGMGYLQTCSYTDGRFATLHETSIAVRDFVWIEDAQLVLVNQGMHGITALRYDDKGFTKLGELKPPGAIQQLAAATDGKFIAVSDQDSGAISVYELSA